MKKVQRWGDGRAIEPVDLTAASPVREAFSVDVLGMPVAGVKNYWMERIAKGVYPARIKEADAEVIGYVSGHPGGISWCLVPARRSPTCTTSSRVWRRPRSASRT